MTGGETPTRRLTYDKIAETEIEQYPVVHAEFQDTGSYANVIIDGEDGLLRVAQVESRVRGDMRRILDDITEQLDCPWVRFMVPLNERLEQQLSGFERRMETVDGPDGPTEVEVLDGEWRQAEQETLV